MDFGLHFGLQKPPLGASWPSLGHFWTPSGWSWAPSGGILALREAPGWIFEASKGVWGQLLACLLATIFAYNCWIDLLHELLHETHLDIHLRFSFTPCSAAVRAQHMELLVIVVDLASSSPLGVSVAAPKRPSELQLGAS